MCEAGCEGEMCVRQGVRVRYVCEAGCAGEVCVRQGVRVRCV